MDFELSPTQQLIQDSVRGFLAGECPIERARALSETPTAFDEKLWRGMAAQGWIGLMLAEEHGGLGLGAVELAAVCEIMGEACLPGPFLSTLWGAATIEAANQRALADRYLPQIAAGELVATVALLEEDANWDPSQVQLAAEPTDGGYRLSGSKLFVADAEVAGLILVVSRAEGEPAVFMVAGDASGIGVAPTPAIDPTRKLYRVEFEDVHVSSDQVLARGDDALAALAAGTELAIVGVCAELVGGMQWVLDTSVEYAKTRQQFGRAIGTYQAVQHMCADMLLSVESARSAAYYSAWAVSVNDPEASTAVSVAKAYCSDAARQVGNSGIQVHGGFGFTWEHDLHVYYRRAKASEILFGDAIFHREQIARRVIDGSVTATEKQVTAISAETA